MNTVSDERRSCSLSQNYGSLSGIIQDTRGAEAFTTTSSEAFTPGIHVDVTATLGSLILLIILLGIAFERVLGLDRIVSNALQEWKAKRVAKRRKDMLDAKDRLERLFGEDVPD